MNIHAFDIAVILIAIVQALTVLLSWGRDRDIKRLHERIDQQQLLISEIQGWLKRDVIEKSRQDRPDREPIPAANDIKAPEPAVTPQDVPDAVPPGTAEDELKRSAKANDWSREIVASLRAGLKGGAPAIASVPEPATVPKDLPDTLRPGTAEDEDQLKRATKTFKWFKEDAGEARELVEAREIVAGLKGTPPEPATTPKDLPDTARPGTTEDEDALKRAAKAINWLKEDTDKAREIFAVANGSPPEKAG